MPGSDRYVHARHDLARHGSLLLELQIQLIHDHALRSPLLRRPKIEEAVIRIVAATPTPEAEEAELIRAGIGFVRRTDEPDPERHVDLRIVGIWDMRDCRYPAHEVHRCGAPHARLSISSPRGAPV